MNLIGVLRYLFYVFCRFGARSSTVSGLADSLLEQADTLDVQSTLHTEESIDAELIEDTTMVARSDEFISENFPSNTDAGLSLLTDFLYWYCSSNRIAY